MEIKEIVNQFVKEQIEKEEKLIGAIFYGSHCYETAKPDSDIDLLFVSNGKHQYRGLKMISEKRVEFFVIPLETIKKNCFTAFMNQDSVLYSIFKNGQIIYEEGKELQKMKRFFELRYHTTYPIYKLDAQEKGKLITNWIELNSCSSNPSVFWIMYYNLLNSIRIYHQQRFGLSKMPTCNLVSLYQNREYAEEFYCATLPSEDFTELFLACIQEKNIPDALIGMKKLAQKQYLEFPPYNPSSKPKDFRQEKFYHTPKSYELLEQSTVLTTKFRKTKQALLNATIEADFLYAITIEQLRKFYEIQCGVLNNNLQIALVNYQYITKDHVFTKIDPEFIPIYMQALQSQTKEEKLEALEKLFHFTLKDIPLSEKEYLIRINGTSREKRENK